MKRKQSLSKNQRLKGVSATKALFNCPQVVSCYPFKLFFKVEKQELSEIKFGVAVPKKKFKRAVDRNRIKRLTREYYRTSDELGNFKIETGKISLMFIYIASFEEKQEKIQQGINTLLKRLNQEVEEND